MTNPFSNRVPSLAGPATSMQAVAPNDVAPLEKTAVALYVEVSGTVRFVSVAGDTCTVEVGNFAILPVGVTQVLNTGTTATGIHAFTVN